jgi:hypothetical protein
VVILQSMLHAGPGGNEGGGRAVQRAGMVPRPTKRQARNRARFTRLFVPFTPGCRGYSFWVQP